MIYLLTSSPKHHQLLFRLHCAVQHAVTSYGFEDEKKRRKSSFAAFCRRLESVRTVSRIPVCRGVSFYASKSPRAWPRFDFDLLTRCTSSRETFASQMSENHPVPALPADEPGREVYRELLRFRLDDRETQIRVGHKVSGFRRRAIHELAEQFNMIHEGSGHGAQRHVLIKKRSAKGHGHALHHKKSKKSKAQSRRGSLNTDDLKQHAVGSQPAREELQNQLAEFVANDGRQSYNFPVSFSRETRAIVHELASAFQLDHDSFGIKGQDRYVRVTKVDPEVLRRRQQKQAGLNVAYECYLDKIKEARERCEPLSSRRVVELKTPKKPTKSAKAFRHLQWNIEWMDYLFKSTGDDNLAEFLSENHSADISSVPELCQKIAKVILDLEPDVISVEEGPSSREKMELFVKDYLNSAFEVQGGMENLSQQLFLLVRKNGPIQNVQLHQKSLAYLTQSWFFDVDGDRSLMDYKFTRRPLVVEATIGTGELSCAFLS